MNPFFKCLLIFVYLFGCVGSQLQHTGSEIFVVACRVFSCRLGTLSCSMWDLVPWPGIEPGSPALGAQSLSHWTTREVPMNQFDYFPREFISKTIFTFYCHTRVLLGAKAPTSISINMLQFLRWKKLKTGERDLKSPICTLFSYFSFLPSPK